MVRPRCAPFGLAAALAASSATLACGSSDTSPGLKPTGSGGASAHAGPGMDASSTGGGGSDGGGIATDSGHDVGSRGPSDSTIRMDGSRASDGAHDSGATAADVGGPLAPLVCNGAGTHFATSVVSFEFGPGQNSGQTQFPAWVLGPPTGAGACQGAVDGVVSLGNGGTVTLAFGNDAIVDGPGPDFIVFENAFGVNCDLSNVFAELATVEVSDDGVTWRTYPCTATVPPYGACAGWHPVYANADTNTIDPRDPTTAGGDPFDLADVGLSRARLVRITDRADLDGLNGVFDLDAVSIVNSACP